MMLARSDFSLSQTQATVEAEVDMVAVKILPWKVGHIINPSFFFFFFFFFQAVEATAVAIIKEGAPADTVEARAVVATVAAVMAETVEVGVVAMVAEATTAATVARVCDS